MEYIYAKQRNVYEDFASGRVLLNAKGTTAFPVRLASELFQRGLSYLQLKSDKDHFSLYDPCCGGAHLLTTIGILHGSNINRIVGSDIDEKVKDIATSNLAMINIEGLNNRFQQIKQMYDQFGKKSHLEAMESAERLRKMIANRRSTIETAFFQADATDHLNVAETKVPFDMVITDLPYGELVEWRSTECNPVERLLENLLDVITSDGIVIIVSDKKQFIQHPQYNRLERFKVGKRQVVFLEPK